MRWESEEAKEYGDHDYNDPFSDRDVMRLDIFPSKIADGVKASFLFGLFEGTMLLAKSSRRLELFRNAQPKGLSKYEEDSDEGTFGENFGEGGVVHGTLPYTPQQRAFWDQASVVNNNLNVKKEPETGQKRRIGDISDPWGVQEARANRQQMGSTSTGPNPEPEQREERKQDSHPDRVYFQFVANCVDSYPDVDDKNENIGYLDFDEARLAAKGKFVWPTRFGEAQSISIFKVAEQPNHKNEPEQWYRYDGRHWGR